MRFVITGATSFIGLELTMYLTSIGHDVIAVCRCNSKGRVFFPHEVKIVYAEMLQYNTLPLLIDKADVFINLAWAGTGHSDRNVEVVQSENVSNSINAIYAAQEMGCKVFVETGSQAEYGSTQVQQREDIECIPFSEYGKAKLKIKEKGFELAEKMGIKYVHLRIFSVYGEKDHEWTLVMSVLDKMLKNECVNLSSCIQNWNFIYVRDAVRIIYNLCQNAINDSDFIHEVYNIASNDTRQLKQFVESMKMLTNSMSSLNYGAIVPNTFVSLQPDMSKTIKASNYECFRSFDEVILSIIRNKKK